MGMCFLDELINNSSSLEAIIVDQRDKPGGHWNDAYSFVRLHQPAAFYGVNSRPLGNPLDLSTRDEILACAGCRLEATFLNSCASLHKS